tara:strand:- start:147 stop:593 length:447 start_codon:yes stop_codon:yes gene_type:complete
MLNLLKIPKKHSWLYVLVALFIVFIVLPINIPPELAKLIDSSIGKIVIVVLVINLFMFNPIVGTVGAVAAYEIIRRSTGYSSLYSGIDSNFLQSEKIKTSVLKTMNNFPYTVEEEVIKKQMPFTYNLTDINMSPFNPVKDDIHSAVDV